uniref:Protein kinase domain-containing protein n=1 Tax=Ananas comosus var. bracteatus TaxID=296719 RepID=A0A6V7QNX1_ANACO|nr:unnamed protein product [Ananas comosus var. bracteatus]
MSPLILYHLIFLSYLSAAVPQQQPYPNRCGERCGGVVLPFPFHLNSSCGPAVDAFRLSCRSPTPARSTSPSPPPPISASSVSSPPAPSSSTTPPSSTPLPLRPLVRGCRQIPRPRPEPFLRGHRRERPPAVRLRGLVDMPGGVRGDRRRGVRREQPHGLRVLLPALGRERVEGRGRVLGVRGVRLPRLLELVCEPGSGGGGGAVACAEGAVVVNATAVHGGVRCACGAGYVGDGFAQGAGCFKDCSGDGQVTDSRDCCKGRFCTKRAAALAAGVSVSAFFLAAAVVFCFLLRQPVKDTKWDFDPACLPKILGKACNTRQFTYEELNEATKGFEDQKLVDFVDRSVHTGVLYDGSVVAVQKVNCETQEHLRQVLERVEILSQISHRNIARIIGFCFDSNNALLLVHEHFSNGTLREHIRRERGNSLSWYLRVNVASEVAGALAYLQSQVAIPINLNDLKSSEILVDVQYAAKIAGYKLITSQFANGSCSYTVPCDSDVVCNFGRLLMELITGSEHEHTLEMVSSKVKDGKVHEIVDSSLIHGERQLVENEVERVASLAVRCLSRRENGGPCMFEVVKELLGIVKENIGSSSRIEITLEETFSNSSLLQMISMSPESMRIQ